ncbi:MAG TPA: hypothetical protein VEW48_14020 [Thermoanaerobaculia bacterium]|nr:hypothetical protein [Thermoanaerobaculia bacterium]
MIPKSLARPSATTTLLLAAFLTACGGAGSESGSTLTVPDGFDTCSILTQERAQAIAGTPVAGITSTLEDAQGRGPLYCPYNAGTIEQPRLVGLEIRPAGTPSLAASRMEAAKPYLERLSKKTISDIPNFGDAAYWVPGLQQLHTRRGSLVIVATVQAGENPLDDAKRITSDTIAALEKAAAQKKKGKTAA